MGITHRMRIRLVYFFFSLYFSCGPRLHPFPTSIIDACVFSHTSSCIRIGCSQLIIPIYKTMGFSVSKQCSKLVRQLHPIRKQLRSPAICV